MVRLRGRLRPFAKRVGEFAEEQKQALQRQRTIAILKGEEKEVEKIKKLEREVEQLESRAVRRRGLELRKREARAKIRRFKKRAKELRREEFRAKLEPFARAFKTAKRVRKKIPVGLEIGSPEYMAKIRKMRGKKRRKKCKPYSRRRARKKVEELTMI